MSKFVPGMDDVVVVAGARTPFDRFGGVMRSVPSYKLGAWAINGAISRIGLPKEAVAEVIMGVCEVAEVALRRNVMARQALLEAGLPETTVSLTVDRACCSSTAATQVALMKLRLNEGEVIIAGGAENMSRQPYLTDPDWRWEGPRHGHILLRDPEFEITYEGYGTLAVDAGEVALEYGISREEQDAWALLTQQRYARALAADKFKEEIIPISLPQKKGPDLVLDHDTQPRPETTMKTLAKLPTVYGSPTVTAGNAPGLNAGGAALIFMKRKKAHEYGFEPLATVLDIASIARTPREIAAAPAPAIQKALAKAGLALSDISLLEINEAFAAMPLVSTQILADGDPQKTNALRKITNVNGGAIAIGHPVGATGARLMMTLMHELRRRGGGYGAVGICGGLAHADSVIIRVD